MTGSLAGVRVLAVEHFLAGPYATMLMADHGADVVKVEPKAGDGSRQVGPFAEGYGEESSVAFIRMNRNKRSVLLDLRDPQDLEAMHRLIHATDVLVENLRPGALASFGLGYPDLVRLNPAIVYTSVSGFGSADLLPGPYMEWPAFDLVAQGMTGLLYRAENSTDAPVHLGFSLTDLYAGTLAFSGTVMALFARERTGQPQRVDISLYDSGIALNEHAVAIAAATGQPPPPGLRATDALYGYFPVADGFVTISCPGDSLWRRFCCAIGRPELAEVEGLRTVRERSQDRDRVHAIALSWLAQRTAAEATRILLEHGVPSGLVLNADDVLASPHARARAAIVRLDDPYWGRIEVAGNPIKNSDHPIPLRPAPGLGEHTEAILAEWSGPTADH